MVRRYAPVVGVVILLLGPAGLTLGDEQLGGALNIDPAEDLVHLVTGGLLASVGFAPVAPGRRRTVHRGGRAGGALPPGGAAGLR